MVGEHHEGVAGRAIALEHALERVDQGAAREQREIAVDQIGRLREPLPALSVAKPFRGAFCVARSSTRSSTPRPWACIPTPAFRRFPRTS
jgi:hypothetical protein